MDWFKGKFTGKHHIWWENPWFPVDFPLNQSIDGYITMKTHCLWIFTCLEAASRNHGRHHQVAQHYKVATQSAGAGAGAPLAGVDRGGTQDGPSAGVKMGIPSGNDEHSYWKWQFIVSFPMKNGDFP